MSYSHHTRRPRHLEALVVRVVADRCDRRVGPDRAKTGAKGAVRASIGGRCFQNRHSAVGRQLWLLDRYAEAHPEASSDLELVQSLWIQEVPKK